MREILIALALYSILGLSYYGWGNALATILRVDHKTPDHLSMSIWLGWAFTLLLFQVINLVLPINAYVAIPLFLLGAVLSITGLINWLKSLFKCPRPFTSTQIITTFLVTLFFLSVVIWVSARAMLPPTNYDSGLYHLTSIRWINSYPIIPGLGNLHSRLAYNQSFFVYVAALNFYPFFGYGRSIANSFLFMVLIGAEFITLYSIFSKRGFSTKHPFSYAPDLFIIPVIAFLAIESDGLTSPTPDLASTILQIAIFVELSHGISEWREGQKDQNFRAFVIIILAATAVTVKLSSLGFSLVSMGIVLLYVWQTTHPRIRGIVHIILPVVVILSVWMARGYIFSGVPVFPSSLGYIPFTWAMPKAAVITEANSILGWARQPQAITSTVLGNWNWFGPWFLKVSKEIVSVVYPFLVSIAFLFLTLIMEILLFVKKRLKPGYSESIIILPILLGLIYWFITAPDPRFANAIFWLLPIGTAMVLLACLYRVLDRRVFLVIVCFIFIIVNVRISMNVFADRNSFKQISLSGWYPVPIVPIIEERTNSGLILYEPEKGDQAWDAPLPNTPRFNADLRLIIPGNLASGFTVKPVSPNGP
jgi:hypothetical protein